MDEDISEPTKAEALSAITMAPIGIAIFNLDGTIRWANDCLCEMLRYPLDELVGMHFRQITVQHDQRRDTEAFSRLMKTGRPYGMFQQWVQRGGSGIIAGDLRVEVHRERGEVRVAIGYMTPSEHAQAMVESVLASMAQEGRLDVLRQPAFDPQVWMKRWWPLITAAVALEGMILAGSIGFVVQMIRG